MHFFEEEFFEHMNIGFINIQIAFADRALIQSNQFQFLLRCHTKIDSTKNNDNILWYKCL